MEEFKYRITQTRLLYVLSIDDNKHQGLLKVGEVLVDNNLADYSDFQMWEKEIRNQLDQREYMQRRRVAYRIEYVTSTMYNQNEESYKVHDVVRTLADEVSAHYLEKIKKEDADLWFACSVEDVKNAIEKVKSGYQPGHGEIKFRPEQEKAIADTVTHFKNAAKQEAGKKDKKVFLWNAKMRFGKTLSGLEVARRMEFKSILIITHRPVVDQGWHDDFEMILGKKQNPEKLSAEYVYATRMNDTDSSGGDFYTLTNEVNAGKKRLVFFVSMQYLRLSQYVGGKEHHLDPLKKAIMQYDWDFVMVDEAHEGIESAAGDRVMAKLKKKNTCILSLSGTPFNLLDKYESDEIYTWDYVMEQKAKQEWDDKHFGDPNPYTDLPRMQILTFQLDKMVRDGAIANNEGFRFHEFFRVWTPDDKNRLQNSLLATKDAGLQAELKAQLDSYSEGKFVHEDAVRRFITKLRTKSESSLYPFSTDEFRSKFRHTFWLLPGVKEAKALEDLLHEDEVFRNMCIINVAGDGNIEDKDGRALAAVKNNIEGNHDAGITAKEYTITLSCGKLTTGVSVPQWTAVLCMKGSENTPAANYMQTIFRVQTSATLKGRQKTECYVFDFAPERALIAVAETAKMAVYAQGENGKKLLKLNQQKEEEHLAAFIKLCPVLSMDEGEMGKHISANDIFGKLNKVYIERAVRSGYSDNSLYNQEQLMNLTPEQEKVLGDVHDLLGSIPTGWKPDKININKNGLGDVKGADKVKYIYYLSGKDEAPATPSKADEMDENGCPTTKDDGWDDTMCAPTAMFPYLFVSHSRLDNGEWSPFTQPVVWRQYVEKDPVEEEEKKKREKENNEKRARMSVLRGVSIRIPLLVYGAEINDEAGDEITIDNFASEEIVDQASWDEFMPKGFTKETFNILKDCFDRSIFTGAAKRIRSMVKEADTLNTEDRIDKIATIFSYLHNPDKETVLTPWKVVNMHLSKSIGGWCFRNEEYDGPYLEENEYGENISTARPVGMIKDENDQIIFTNKVTQDIFGDYNSRILEVNSKTGLYPLYMAYSLFKTTKEAAFRRIELTGVRGKSKDADEYDEQAINDLEIWKDVLQDNIFVVCRTKMAASITRRTLAGFRKDIRVNVVCYSDKVDVNSLVSSGVIKKDDIHLKKQQSTYYYNGEPSLECDIINVLRAKPKLFTDKVVKGNDFWHVYKSIPKKKEEDINNMKFNVVVGNPPYQLTVIKKETDNGQKPVVNIFHYFQINSEIISNYTSLIYPGGRWIHRSGKGLEQFGLNQINDVHLKRVELFPDANDVFEKVGLPDGVSVVLKDMSKTEGGFEYVYTDKDQSCSFNMKNPGKDLMPLNPYNIGIVEKINKTVSENKFSFLHDSILARSLFSIESNFVEENPELVREYVDGDLFFDPKKEIKLLTNDKAGKSGRAKWFIANRDVITTGKEYLNKWKVVVSSANAGGQKRSNQIAILDNYSAFGRSRVALKAFDSKAEAENFFKFAKSELIRFAFLLTDENLTSLAKQVPDLINYTNDNGIIDYTGDINAQLYELFDISGEEQNYIRNILSTKTE